MNGSRIAGIALIVIGVIGLSYGGLTYSKGRQDIQMGSMSFSMSEQRTIPVPLWAGIAALVIGTGLLYAPGRKG